jgi:hypothetical protein
VTWHSLSLCRAPTFSVVVNLSSKLFVASLAFGSMNKNSALQSWNGSGLSVDLTVKLVVKERIESCKISLIYSASIEMKQVMK